MRAHRHTLLPGPAHLLLDEVGAQLQLCIQAVPLFPKLLQFKAQVCIQWGCRFGWGTAGTAMIESEKIPPASTWLVPPHLLGPSGS